jgi:hypothetical protein
MSSRSARARDELELQLGSSSLELGSFTPISKGDLLIRTEKEVEETQIRIQLKTQFKHNG